MQPRAERGDASAASPGAAAWADLSPPDQLCSRWQGPGGGGPGASDHPARGGGGSAADWIGARLQPWSRGWLSVGRVVPTGFERYIRLLPPAWLGGVRQVRWSRVAQWSGKPLMAATFFSDLGTRQGGVRWLSMGTPPRAGQLDADVSSRLASLLARFTATPEMSWSCVWSGWGDIQDDKASLINITPSISASGRRYARYRGSVRAMTALLGLGHAGRFQAPSFWWPSDRAWFVSTEIDSESRYMAGCDALIRRLLGEPVLETLAAALTDPFDGTHAGQENRE